MSIYKYTFRFNASHSNTGDMSKVHTHSFIVSVFMKYKEYITYDKTEKDIKEYLSKYKGQCLNEFFEKDPTIENLAEYLFEDLDEIIGDHNLVTLELSDSPVQLYRIRRTE